MNVSNRPGSETVTEQETSAATAVGLRLSGVTKSFGDREVLHLDELTCEPGEFLTLVGPSGCGKTTTMRLIAGLEHPTSGDIYFGDRRINDVPVQRRDVALVFQNYALYPNMTVWQNLEYGLKRRKVPKPERESATQDTAALLRIQHLLDHYPRQLSGGEQQRVALGRAIVRSPQVFLLDEPLSNLDAKLRTEMRAEIVKLHRRVGATMVYVTHDQLEALTMSTHVAVMDGGRVQQYDTPYRTYHAPANLFVAGFVGSPRMNFIDGKVHQEHGALRFVSSGLDIPIASGPTASVLERLRGKVTLGARPEQVDLLDGAVARTDGLVGVVEYVEVAGADSYITVDTPSGSLQVRARRHVPRLGDRVSLTFDGLHVFDASGNRVELAAESR